MAYTFTRTGAQIEEIHNTVEDPKSNAQFSDDIRTIAGEYRGLWPDTGGSANKGDTYQTQVSGTGTGQYFTALQNTTVDPVGDDVNWREVVSSRSIGGLTNYQAASVDDAINGKSLNRTVSLALNQRWTVDDYYGGANPSDSGILFFKVVAAGTGTDDGGRYIDVPGGLFQLEQNLKKPYHLKAWGARLDGTSFESDIAQRVLDLGKETVFSGILKTNSPLTLKTAGQIFRSSGVGQSTDLIDCYIQSSFAGEFSAIQFENDINSCTVRDLYIRVREENTYGINISGTSYSTFSNFFIQLESSRNVGIYGVGDTNGYNPYFNAISDFTILGALRAGGVTGQKGILFSPNTSQGTSAPGPNANVISNAKRIVGVDVAIDNQGGNGNVFTNLTLEGIHEVALDFNNHGGTESFCVGNQVSNVRMEGTPGEAVFCVFREGAVSNKVNNYYVTSISPVTWQDFSGATSNQCIPSGSVFTVSFFGENIPANSTTSLTPINTGAEGGYMVPLDSFPVSVSASLNRYTTSNVGTGTVRFFKSGAAIDEVQLVFDETNRLRANQMYPKQDVSDLYLTSSGHGISASITTDADWDATSSDISVTVVFGIL